MDEALIKISLVPVQDWVEVVPLEVLHRRLIQTAVSKLNVMSMKNNLIFKTINFLITIKS